MVLVPVHKNNFGREMESHATLTLLSRTCILPAAFLVPFLLQQVDQDVGWLCRYGLRM